ncbi:MAG TPA: 1-acyl-sn-glycerol-3-phosphate acyltransferase [Turneriella sp.]|nr:1-acyl-sn-glycerol-3-phosphate acyltransferase [Turneriella sp.]
MGKYVIPDKATDEVARFLARSIKFLPEGFFDILAAYFRLEIEGEENLPNNGRGRMLIVPNHSNALGYDAFMIIMALKKITRRIPRTMGHTFWFSNGFLAAFSRAMGTFPADLKEGLNALRDDNMVVIFPEGAEGNFKVSSTMYKMVDFNPGFVPLAIMQQAPVVPAAIIGAEESTINLAKIDWFKDIIGASIPVPLNLIPFPAKWKIKFLPAIDFSKYNKKDIKDARFVKEINQNIRYRIQNELNKEVSKRNIAFK